MIISIYIYIYIWNLAQSLHFLCGFDDLDFVSRSQVCKKYQLQTVLFRCLFRFLPTVMSMFYDHCETLVCSRDIIYMFLVSQVSGHVRNFKVSLNSHYDPQICLDCVSNAFIPFHQRICKGVPICVSDVIAMWKYQKRTNGRYPPPKKKKSWRAKFPWHVTSQGYHGGAGRVNHTCCPGSNMGKLCAVFGVGQIQVKSQA